MNSNFESLSNQELEQVNGGVGLLLLQASFLHGFASTAVSDVKANIAANVFADLTAKKINFANNFALDLISYLKGQKAANIL